MAESPEREHECVWCCMHYFKTYSHARAAELFCSRRCETEARYWLFAVLSKIQDWRAGAGF